VLAIVCDSTNVFTEGTSGSEADLRESLTRLIAAASGRVAVACFATNVARLETIAAAAADNGRDVVLAGRSMRRIEEAARENGYLASVRAFLDEADAGYLPRDKTAIICTGSQGEPRAALARIAAGDHPRVALEPGDTVIFSSRVIPGNETAIARLQNQLAQRSIEVITWHDEFVHVSGHPARDELVRMYQLARPRIAVPVHGEARHLMAHARLARECQVTETVVAENGAVVRLAPDPAGVIESVPAGRLALEGNRVVSLEGELVRSRLRALYNGSAVVTIALDRDGRLAGVPQLTAIGLLEAGDATLTDEIAAAIGKVLDGLPRAARDDDATVKEAVRVTVRRAFRDRLDKKPVTSVHLVRVG